MAEKLHIDVVCTGNICRSPMGEALIRDRLEKEGLADQVIVTSSGMAGYHVGDRPDPRTLLELSQAGVSTSSLIAQRFDDDHAAADLIIAMDSGHRTQLLDAGVKHDSIRLLRSFDPAADGEADVADPYYGEQDDFAVVHEQIDAALPGIVDWVRENLGTTER